MVLDNRKWKELSDSIQLLVNSALNLALLHDYFGPHFLQLKRFMPDVVSFCLMWFHGSLGAMLRALLALFRASIAPRTRLSFFPRWSPMKVTSMIARIH